MKRRLFSLRFYLFGDHGPAADFVVGIDMPCPGAARLVRGRLWWEVEPGTEVRFGNGTYYVGAIALEHCLPVEESGRLVRSGIHWLGGAKSQPLKPPEPPREWSRIGKLLASAVKPPDQR